ncbi:MAG: hypothetical protein JWQ74_1774, partial [Marmoricola sp.]|nr:hypothetical protein [Marmoricola sp.]
GKGHEADALVHGTSLPEGTDTEN